MASRASISAQRRSFWLEHFEARASSGLSVKAYTEQHGLSSASYYSAHRRYAPSGPESNGGAASLASQPALRFACVTTPASHSEASVGCRVHLPGGVVIEVDARIDDLPQLARAFSRAP